MPMWLEQGYSKLIVTGSICVCPKYISVFALITSSSSWTQLQQLIKSTVRERGKEEGGAEKKISGRYSCSGTK